MISSRELELAIKESLEYLSLGYGTEASVFSSCEDEQIPVRSALDACEILESFLEALVLKSSTVMITILPEDGYDLMIKAVISIPDRVNREEFTDECADIGLLHEDKVIFGEPDDDEEDGTVYITIKEAAHG
ncbi:MAG: hypothetical protein K5888_02850 [Lachnospiraceae bacterium]|nr:hypothetical protein [Lachnospiraceae bacterium]